MIQHSIAFCSILLAALSSAASTYTISANTTVGTADAATYSAYTSGDTLEIPSGVTLTFQNGGTPITLAARLSGGGKIVANSAAVLTLDGDNSGFSGSFEFNNATCTVTRATSFGTASVLVKTRGSLFFATSGTFSNAFTVQGTSWGMDASGDVVFTGDVTISTATGGNSIGNVKGSTGSLEFRKKLTRGNTQTLWIYLPITFAEDLVYGNVSPSLKLTDQLFVNSGCTLDVYNDLSNSLGLFTAKGRINLHRDDAILNKPLRIGSPASPYGIVDLCGTSQQIGTLDAPASKNATLFADCAVVTSETPATLTVAGDAYGDAATLPCNVCFDGAVSLVFDGGENASYWFTNVMVKGGSGAKFSSDTTGTVTVASGRLRLGKDTSFTALSSVSVSNGTLQLDNGASVNKSVDLYLGGDGKLDLAAGVTLSVNRLFVVNAEGTGYEQMGFGRYAATAAAGVKEMECISGEGVLYVRSPRPGTKLTIH